MPHAAESPALHPVHVGTHTCVLIFLEAHGCPLSLSSSSSSSTTTIIMWRRGRAAMHSSHAQQPCTAAMHSRRVGRQWDDHHQPRSALACHVLLDADAKHTQYHTGPTSHPPLLFHSISLPSLPHDATHRHTTTKKVSAPPCSRASTHAIAAMGRWCGVGRGSNRREEEEEAQHLTHSHMYHLLLVCACVACRWRRT